MQVDLIVLGATAPQGKAWPLGEARSCAANPQAVAAAVSALERKAGYVLFWDADLGRPDIARVRAAAAAPGDVRHAGLRLGMAGLPRSIDFVDPVWRFNRDPDPDIEATSWRLSLGACLARAEVLSQLGGPDPRFDTLAGASLELGHRWISNGALLRHAPELLAPGMAVSEPPELTRGDEARFLQLRYGRMWAVWAGFRVARHGGGLTTAVHYLRPFAPVVAAPATPLHPARDAAYSSPREPELTVTVLIPTVDRYPHLFNLLNQLRRQTTQPLEIIVVDQTARGSRNTDWPARYADLPLRVVTQERAGQCSSRNAGLRLARGDAVLFLDDDDEVPPDLIERHLETLRRFAADASCGVAEEVNAGPLPAEFTLVRDSDVFPTNNTLLRLPALAGSGLFDLAFERGERADHDLGMRLYLAGAQLVLNPAASVVHLHAPRGGLRQHGARVVTRSASRAGIRRRHLLAPTEAYLWSRYFTTRQTNEALLIRTLGTLRGSGGAGQRLLKLAIMAFLLPDTWRRNRNRLAEGRAMLHNYPSIPAYQPAPAEELLNEVVTVYP